MTLFMLAVQNALDGCTSGEPAAVQVTPVPDASDVHLAIRSLAEQLICKADAVPRESGDVSAVRWLARPSC